MLTLTIKRKWFEMIIDSDKQEKYREIMRKEIAALLEATSADASDEAVEAALRRFANIVTQTEFSFSEVISEVSSVVMGRWKTLDEALCSLEARYGVLKEADT